MALVVVWRWNSQDSVPVLLTTAPAPERTEAAQAGAQAAVLRVYFRPFDDSPASLQQLGDILPLLPRVELTAEAGASVSSRLPAFFGVDAEQLPRTFALISAFAYAGGTDTAVATIPETGRIYVPAVPLGRAANDRLEYSRVGIRQTLADVSALLLRQMAFVTTAPLPAAESGADGHIVDYVIPPGRGLNEQAERLVATGHAALISNPIELDLAVVPSPGPGAPFPQQADLNAIGAFPLTASGPIDLFVVDVDMPAARYDDSIKRLFELCGEVRAKFGMSPNSHTVPPFVAVPRAHSDGIVEALDQLERLDRGARVRVTYVPLSKAQGMEPALRELLMIGEIVRLRGFSVNPAGRATNKETQLASEAASTALEALPASAGAVVRSDAAILDALALVASAATERRGTRYVINYSWIVKSGVIPLVAREEERGVTVVAAGNNDTDVSTAKQDFARRSILHATFLTVMNLDGGGNRAGRSAYFDPGALPHARVVGFDGAISSSTATSWAAPRVGWLLAFAEATSRTTVADDLWLPELHNRIRALRTTHGPYRSIQVDPVRLATLWH